MAHLRSTADPIRVTFSLLCFATWTSLVCAYSSRNAAKQSVIASRHAELFEEFKVAYGRSYSPGSDEHEMRLVLFGKAVAAVEEQNQRPGRLWNAAINALSDRTPEEISSLGGYQGKAGKHASESFQTASLLQQAPSKAFQLPGQQLPLLGHGSPSFLQATNRDEEIHGLPSDMAWTNLWTTQTEKVRNQNCANCWAAATATLVEAHAQIHFGVNRTVSMKGLTTCTKNTFHCGGEGGCSGATPELALQNIILNGISEDENSQECPEAMVALEDSSAPAPHEWLPQVHDAPLESASRTFGMIGWKRLPKNKYLPLLQAVVQRGPVAVALSTDWHNYGNGIHDGCNKDAVIGHSVVLLGYGKDNQILQDGHPVKYWLIQNSWGAGWGENGRMRLKRVDEEEERCGTDRSPQIGTTCDGGPKEDKVCGMCGMLYDSVVPLFEAKTELSVSLAALRKTV